MWTLIVEGAAAVYLIGLASIISTKDMQSGFVFRFIPMAAGIPLAFIVVAKLAGWPV